MGRHPHAHAKVLPVVREAAPLVASGALFLPVAAVWDLDDIHAAIEQLERGDLCGGPPAGFRASVFALLDHGDRFGKTGWTTRQ